MQDLEQLMNDAVAAVDAAADLIQLDQVRVDYLGRKGLLTRQLKQLGTLPAKQRPSVGQAINEAKQRLQQAVERRREVLEDLQINARLQSEAIDVTLPARGQQPGSLHPVTRTFNEIQSLLVQAGFEVAEGPEIEDNYHNFEALNIPESHPARAMHDTFYIGENLLLRTHTSPVQIRTAAVPFYRAGTRVSL